MNKLQKKYDSDLLTINCIKRLNPINYFKTLKSINNRKTQFPSFFKYNFQKLSQVPFKNYYVKESNKRFNIKIKHIELKPVKPKLNLDFKELNERIKNNMRKTDEIRTQSLKIENKKYKNRIRDQKPKLIRSRYLIKTFNENYYKYKDLLLRNSRFNKKNDKLYSFNLPNIRDKKIITAAKLRSKTEINLNSENSYYKDNSTSYKNKKGQAVSKLRSRTENNLNQEESYYKDNSINIKNKKEIPVNLKAQNFANSEEPLNKDISIEKDNSEKGYKINSVFITDMAGQPKKIIKNN